MPDDTAKEMRIGELAERADVSRRTVRYYISRGLLQGPLRAGRDAVYGAEHLERLAEIKDLQREGLTLQEIGHRLSRPVAQETLPGPTSWWQYPVADDVVVWVKAGASPWRARRIQRALADMARQITEEEVEHERNV